MKDNFFVYEGNQYSPEWNEPSPDLKKVLLGVEKKKNWRHSFSAIYFILDVETQEAEPLVPGKPDARIQLATWSPKSDATTTCISESWTIRRMSSRSPRMAVQSTSTVFPTGSTRKKSLVAAALRGGLTMASTWPSFAQTRRVFPSFQSSSSSSDPVAQTLKREKRRIPRLSRSSIPRLARTTRLLTCSSTTCRRRMSSLSISMVHLRTMIASSTIFSGPVARLSSRRPTVSAMFSRLS
ncbi:hypothetical protein LB505_002277 [Fusarium chuoi]|nr:hypothetical protein LB505_002277 [Fusarium chuoi]